MSSDHCVCKRHFVFIIDSTGLDKKVFDHKIVNISLPICSNICFGCSKELSC